MKYLKILVILLPYFLYSCANVAQNQIQSGWNFEKTIDYDLNYPDIKDDIDKVLNFFDNAIKICPHKWNCGYIQEIQFYVILYFREKIDKKYFLSQLSVVYEKYLMKNQLTNDMILSYAIFNFINSNKTECINLLNLRFEENYKYDFNNYKEKDIKNFVIGILLNKIDSEKFKNTLYVDFLDFTEEDLIEMFIETEN